MINQEPEVLSADEYAAIDLVPPYKPGDGIPLKDSIARANARTQAWLNADEVTEKSA